jgi:hypothetical protein
VNQDNLTSHKMSHRLWVALGFSLALLALSAFWLARQYDKYPRAYARLKPEASNAEVLGSFGKPDDITECRHDPMWDGEPVDLKSAKCVREFSYFTRVRIGEWIVGFDANDRVVTKYYSSSP